MSVLRCTKEVMDAHEDGHKKAHFVLSNFFVDLILRAPTKQVLRRKIYLTPCALHLLTNFREPVAPCLLHTMSTHPVILTAEVSSVFNADFAFALGAKEGAAIQSNPK